MQVSCTWPAWAPEVDVFAYRVHAHSLATAIELSIRRNTNRDTNRDTNGDSLASVWETLGRRSPQQPQIFVGLPATVRLAAGDRLRVVCWYNSSEESEVTRVCVHPRRLPPHRMDLGGAHTHRFAAGRCAVCRRNVQWLLHVGRTEGGSRVAKIHVHGRLDRV